MDSLKIEATQAVRDYLQYKKINQMDINQWHAMLYEVIYERLENGKFITVGFKFQTFEDTQRYFKTHKDKDDFMELYYSEREFDEHDVLDMRDVMNICWRSLIKKISLEECQVLIKEIEDSTKN